MNRNQYDYCNKKLEKIVSDLDAIKENIEFFGGLQTETMQEEFFDDLESAVISTQDCIEDLESDEEISNLRK